MIFRHRYILLYILIPFFLFGQQEDRRSFTGDTLNSKPKGIDTVITYSANDSIVYSLKTRYMKLYAKSEMRYITIQLISERIDVNWDTATLTSFGVSDSVHADSVIGKPVLKDGDVQYKGEQIDYNFRTQRGRIIVGNTQMDNGFYSGEKIKKVGKDELFVENGRYTTCDLQKPHFHFESPKMKIYVGDIVVAEPVYMYVSDVPVFALPFGIFPSHGGRASGIITPAYGHNQDYGWYISHLGYYWAASDYWDIATMFDLYARGKWMNETQLNYAVRDVLRGGLTTRITSLSRGESDDPDRISQRDYYINVRHNQIISPTSTLDANFTYASSTYFKNFSTSINEILTQNIISNATYSKWWSESNRSVTISLYRDQNLINDDLHEQFPSISFTQNQIYPFKKKKATRGLAAISSVENFSFADMFGFNYSARFSNDKLKRSQIFDSVYTTNGWNYNVREYNKYQTLSFNHGTSIGISPKVGHFTISPSISWNESRKYLTGTQPLLVDSTITFRDTSKWETAGFVNAGIGVSTRFYGLAQPNIFGITAFRHTVTPNLSFSYNKKIYGGYLPKYNLIGSINIGNNFEMKVTKDDSSKSENKIQLLNLGLSTSYNFAADSMNFSDINISYRTDIGSVLSLSGTANYSLYEFDPTARFGYGDRVNRYLLSTKHRIADLTRFSITLSTNLRGDRKTPRKQSHIPQEIINEQEDQSTQLRFQPSSRSVYESMYDREEADFSIPWQIDFSFTFSQNQNNPKIKYRTSSANIGVSFNLTEKWKISSRGSYDFVQKQHYIQYIEVTRDLHCWQMNFTYYPKGMLAGFRFELRVAAPQLQDIKITKQTTRPY